MKKLLACVLALGLAVSTSVTAFAEDAATTETNDSTKSTEIAVNGSYQAATPAGSSISVDVVWEDMSFTYTGESKGAWDPKTHEYGADIPAHWAWSKATEDKTAPNITLTNHSDTGVKAKFAFTPEVGGLNGTFTGTDGNPLTDNALTLPTAVETDPANAPSAVTSFSVDGSGIETNQQLGSITVTVAKDGATTPDTPQETVEVGSEEALRAAITEGKSVKLTDSLTLNETLELGTYSGTIDLNGNTLNNESSTVIDIRNSVTIKNGTITGYHALWCNNDSNLTVENCILNGIDSPQSDAFIMSNATAVFKDCTFNIQGNYSYALNIDGGKATLSGKTIITTNSTDSPIQVVHEGSLTCLAGTYNFDPTAYVDTNKYTVTDNNNGTWTVTEGTTGGDTSPEAQVGDKDALNAAVDGKKETITLTDNIALSYALCLTGNYTSTIDLNHHKLSNNGGSVIEALNQATLSIKNGTLESTNSNTNALNVGFGTTVNVDDCTIKTETAPALLVAGTAALHDCTIQSTGNTYALEFVNNGRLTLSGITNITGSSVATNDTDGSTNNSLFKGGNVSSLTCLAGTYNFDPTPYVNTGTYKIIKNNEANTWTVTTGESTGEDTPTTPGITTFEALKAAIDSSTTGSEVITLGADISTGSVLKIPEEKEVTIDLGGYTLTSTGYCAIENKGTVTIKNGTIEGANNSATIVNEHSLTADGLTVKNTKDQVIEAKNAEKTELTKCNLSSADYSVIHLYACGATIVDCTLTSTSKTAIRYSDNGAVGTPMITIGGTTTINDYIVANTGSTCKIKVQDGCSFDPEQHYDKNTNTLTKDSVDIWKLEYSANASTGSE